MESVEWIIPRSLLTLFKWENTDLFEERFKNLSLQMFKLSGLHPGVCRVKTQVLYEKILTTFHGGQSENSLKLLTQFRPRMYYIFKRIESVETQIKIASSSGASQEELVLLEIKKIFYLKKFKTLVNQLRNLDDYIIKEFRVVITF